MFLSQMTISLTINKVLNYPKFRGILKNVLKTFLRTTIIKVPQGFLYFGTKVLEELLVGWSLCTQPLGRRLSEYGASLLFSNKYLVPFLCLFFILGS